MNIQKSRKYYYSLTQAEPCRRGPNKQNIDLHQAYSKLLAQNKRLQSQLDTAEQSNSELQQKLQQADRYNCELHSKYQSTVDTLRREFVQMEDNMAKIQKLLYEKEDHITKLKASNDMLGREKQDKVVLAEALAQKQQCITRLISQLQRLSKSSKSVAEAHIAQVNQLEQRLAEQSSTLQNRQLKIQQFQNRIAELEQRRHSVQDSLQKLETENTKLKQQLFSCQNEARLTKQQLSASKVLMQMEILELRTKAKAD